LGCALAAAGLRIDFIGSDELESPELRSNAHVRFINLRGDMRPDVPRSTKVLRLARYYLRLVVYALKSQAPVFHILWNNKIEWFDRTVLMAFYRLLGKRLTFTVHNVNVRKRDGNDSVWNRATLRLQYRLVHHLFVHTDLMRRQLCEEFDVPAEKVSVIPFGVNSTVPDTPLDREQARARLGLSASDRVLLFFGNIAPYKGLEFLVEAVAMLADAMPQVRLVIAGRPKGEAEYWKRIERDLARPELSDKVLLKIEYIPDADTEVYFKAADVLVLPYRHVFQSGVLFLAYNFGTPVIASDVGSLREDIVEGDTGYWCAPEDAGALSHAIERFFGSQLHREFAFRRARIRSFAAEKYSWSTVVNITRNVYARLAAQ
jgi:glycosyltransferase involved in cell wall biosynthesis